MGETKMVSFSFPEKIVLGVCAVAIVLTVLAGILAGWALSDVQVLKEATSATVNGTPVNGSTGPAGPGRQVGEIFLHVQSTGVEGALLCDGTVYQALEHSALYAVLPVASITGTTFTIDLRGQFIRGAGNGRVALSPEDDAIKEHMHTYSDVYHQQGEAAAKGDYCWSQANNTTTTSRQTLGVTGGGATETRPVNTALYYWIQAV